MDNKNTGKPPAWHRKSQILTLTVLLGVAPLAQAGTANAAGEAILAAPVKNLDVKWIAGYAGNNASGAPIEINGSTMTIDLANHTSWQIKPGMKLSASSDSTAVSVSIVGSKLAVTVLGAGTANIDLKAATDDGSVSVTDRVQFLISKIGDTTGDGLVTSADALYITKVVNSKVPLSDEEINRLDINRDGKVTSADATALLANYVGKTGPQSVTYIVSIKEVNDAPFLTESAISGTLETGATLTAAYAYRDVESDPEGVSEYKWYKGHAADGSDKAPIAGATARTYVVQDADVGYFLFAEITPVAADGKLRGETVTVSTDKAVPDTTAPTLAATDALTPTGTVAKGDMAKDFVMTFTEKVKAGAGTIKLRKVSGGSEAVSYAANDTAHVTIAGDKVTIKNPGLEDVTAYYVEVEPTAIVDLAGNAYAGTQGSTTWTFTTPDTTAPVLVSQTPETGSLQAPKSAGVDFVLTFNEPVKAVADKHVEIYRVGDTALLKTYAATDGANIVVNGKTVSIKHPELTETESYEVRIESGAFADLSDNAFTGLTSGWSFTVPDITPPVISGVAPANQTVRVNASSDLTISFNEAVRAVAGHAIKIYNAASPSTPLAVIQADDASRVTISDGKVTIANPGLSDNAAYYVDVPAGTFEDLAGNAAPAIAGSSAWSFTTPDTIAPTLTTRTPVDGAVTSSKDFVATLTFSEPVKAVAGKHITIYKASDDTEALKFDAADTVNVKINGNTVTLLYLHMDDDTAYYATVDEGAFTDVEGNAYVGIAGKTAWRFNTPDIFPPTAVTLSPVQQATGVSLTNNFVINFSEPVLTGNGTIRIFRATDRALIASYTADDTTKVTVNGSQATIRNPGLADETEYYIEISSSAFRDAAGNNFSGFTGEQGVWRFTTPDTAAPVISALTPAHQGTGVSQTNDIKLVFNENIKTVSGKKIAIRHAADDSLFAEFDAADTSSVTVSGNMLSVAHAKLDDATDYYVDVEAGAVTDTTGNAFAGINGKSVWRFKSADSRVFEAKNDKEFSEKQMNLDGNAVLTLKITGDQFKDGLGGADIQLNHAPSGVTVGGADKIDGQTVSLRLAFNGTPMDADVTDFSVSVLPSGLASGKTITSNLMTIIALPRLLAITNRAPASGATDTDKRGALSITFDKAVTAAAGKTISIRRKSDDVIVQSIVVSDTAKVTVSGATVTIKPNMLNNLTEYYVLMDAGAFVSGDGSASPAISAKTDWPFRTIEEIPGAYFSQYLDGGAGNIAVEIYNYNPNQDMAGYKVVAYRYMKSEGKVVAEEKQLLSTIYRNGGLYILINNTFYEFMNESVTNIGKPGYVNYYNQDDVEFYRTMDPTLFTLNALVLKDANNKVIDVLGDPTATTAKRFMPDGGTIVRKPQTYGGSPSFQLNQWDIYPKGTYQYIGKHTN